MAAVSRSPANTARRDSLSWSARHSAPPDFLLTYDDQAVNRNLPALIATMLGTGLRAGEASALLWESIDFETGTLAVLATVVRLKGKGLLRKLQPKSDAGRRTLKLPAWCVEMLRCRALAHFTRSDEPVFPAPMGGLGDPSNTSADIKEAFEKAGLGWATSHTLRKTTASICMPKVLPPGRLLTSWATRGQA